MEEEPVIDEAISQGFVDGVSVQNLEDGRGIGRGVVTKRRLVRGERILREAPLLLVVSSKAEELEACEDGSLETVILGRVRELSSEEQDVFWALEDCRCGKGAKTAAGIFLTNQMEVSEIAGGIELVGEVNEELTYPEAEKMKTSHALFLKGCLFNHSCSPNVYWSERSATGEIVFHVLRDVEAGEELAITYSQAVLSMPAAVRQEMLATWRFTCRCQACMLTDEAKSESDSRRTLLNLKMQQLGSGCSDQIAYLHHDEDVQTTQQLIESDPLHGVSIVREVWDLLDQELSGHAPTKSWACIEGFALAERAGRGDLSVEMLELGCKENCLAEGEDSENSQALAGLLSERKGAAEVKKVKAPKAKSNQSSRPGSESSLSGSTSGKPRAKSRSKSRSKSGSK